MNAIKVTVNGRIISTSETDMNYAQCVQLVLDLVKSALEVGPRDPQYPGWPPEVHLEAILASIKAYCTAGPNEEQTA